MKAMTQILEQAILSSSTRFLHKIQHSECPIWQFHYLGAISAYCEMAESLKNQLNKTTYQRLLDMENEALLEISHKNHFDKPTH